MRRVWLFRSFQKTRGLWLVWFFWNQRWDISEIMKPLPLFLLNTQRSPMRKASFQNPWPRPFTYRFRFTRPKFENAVNNILNQLSRTSRSRPGLGTGREGHYSTIPSSQLRSYVELSSIFLIRLDIISFFDRLTVLKPVISKSCTISE